MKPILDDDVRTYVKRLVEKEFGPFSKDINGLEKRQKPVSKAPDIRLKRRKNK